MSINCEIIKIKHRHTTGCIDCCKGMPELIKSKSIGGLHLQSSYFGCQILERYRFNTSLG